MALGMRIDTGDLLYTPTLRMEIGPRVGRNVKVFFEDRTSGDNRSYLRIPINERSKHDLSITAGEQHNDGHMHLVVESDIPVLRSIFYIDPLAKPQNIGEAVHALIQENVFFGPTTTSMSLEQVCSVIESWSKNADEHEKKKIAEIIELLKSTVDAESKKVQGILVQAIAAAKKMSLMGTICMQIGQHLDIGPHISVKLHAVDNKCPGKKLRAAFATAAPDQIKVHREELRERIIRDNPSETFGSVADLSPTEKFNEKSGFLALGRQNGQRLLIGDDVIITTQRIEISGPVYVRVQAPKSIQISEPSLEV